MREKEGDLYLYASDQNSTLCWILSICQSSGGHLIRRGGLPSIILVTEQKLEIENYGQLLSVVSEGALG